MKNLRLIFKNNEYTDFKFVENEVGTNMHHIINTIKYSTDIKTHHHSFSVTDASTYKNELRKIVEQCVNEYNIKMPDIPVIIDRPTLNRIHEAFHVAERENIEVLQAMNPERLLEIQALLKKLNEIIHLIENVDDGNDLYCVFEIAPRSQFEHFTNGTVKPRIELEQNLRKHWRHSSCESDISLTCGYATVGKNLTHCINDNDVELVRQGLVSPQLYVGTETLFRYHDEKYLAEEDRDVNWERHKEQVKSFVLDNNLQQYVGYEDPMHLYSVQPIYATIINNERSKDEWKYLISEIGFDRVELV